MTYRGHVENGVVVLDDPVELPEGAVVQVDLAEEEAIPTLAERLKDVIGIVDGLPEDMAEQHDHYLYGTPKK